MTSPTHNLATIPQAELELQITQLINEYADEWKDLTPDSDPRADVVRLNQILPAGITTRRGVIDAIRAGLTSHSARRESGNFRSLKNIMFLIHFYTLPSADRNSIIDWVAVNEGKESDQISQPPLGSRKQLANLLGYLNTERWHENQRFFLSRWSNLS